MIQQVISDTHLRIKYVFLDSEHRNTANKVSLMFFNENFKDKPSSRSIFNFSIEERNEHEIRHFLGNKDYQNRFNKILE